MEDWRNRQMTLIAVLWVVLMIGVAADLAARDGGSSARY